MCHVGGDPGNRYRGSGAPSYYLEQHVWLHMPVERLAMSLICEGVFDEYPRLQVALVEACLTWSGPLQWAMDAAYEVAGNDAPRLRRLPSEYFREHFWLSTQPIEEPDNPRHLVQSIEFAQMTDRVMFSSDYPHWDFDSPLKALPAAMPAAAAREDHGRERRPPVRPAARPGLNLACRRRLGDTAGMARDGSPWRPPRHPPRTARERPRAGLPDCRATGRPRVASRCPRRSR